MPTSPITRYYASIMLTSRFASDCRGAANECHRACDAHLTNPTPQSAQRALSAFNTLNAFCALFHNPYGVSLDTIDLRDLAAILDPRS